MLFDTDILIWTLRGNRHAAHAIQNEPTRMISVVVYMELLQGARNKREIKAIKDFLHDLGFVVLPLTENIGHRAAIYMEEYSLPAAMSMADALIAGTAMENNQPLLSGNDKHFRVIKDLELHAFHP
ncbi:MAG TPA: type II toxin-antitoxin system VapC family toxin [Phycisphaerae bacterium]|nr:type II toxin-antitoxin system VapC family toxin [Phycisphaerae bacterium]